MSFVAVPRLSSKVILSGRLGPAAVARSFSFSRSLSNEGATRQYQKELDELIYYEKTPDKLRKFIYKPKHAEKVLRAELFDKETGRPLRPAEHSGYPKASVLTNYLNSIETFEDLVIAKNYIRQLDANTNYLNTLHLISFIIASGKFKRVSFGLKTVYNLTNFKFNIELARFIYLVRLSKLEAVPTADFAHLNRKLSAPLHASTQLESADPLLNLLAYSVYGTALIKDNFSKVEEFKKYTAGLVDPILNFSTPQIPDYKELSLGKRCALYKSLKYDHAYLKKAGAVLSELSEESDILPEELQKLIAEKLEPSVAELNEFAESLGEREDFLTELQSKLQFPAVEAATEE